MLPTKRFIWGRIRLLPSSLIAAGALLVTGLYVNQDIYILKMVADFLFDLVAKIMDFINGPAPGTTR